MSDLRKMLKGSDGILKPLVDDFMLENQEKILVLTDSDIAVANKVLETQSVRGEDRSKRTSFSAGQSASCMRAQVIGFTKHKQPSSYPPKVLNIFDDGNWRNVRWIIMFNKMGILVETEETGHNKKYNIGYTPDAIVDLSSYYPNLEGSERIGVEIKGMNLWEWNNFKDGKPRKYSKWSYSRYMQVHAYMLATGAKYWLVWGENKNDQDYQENLIKRDPETIEYLKNRFPYMQKARDKGILPALECDMVREDKKFNSCNQSEACTKIHKEKLMRKLKPLKNRAKFEREVTRMMLR